MKAKLMYEEPLAEFISFENEIITASTCSMYEENHDQIVSFGQKCDDWSEWLTNDELL